MNSQNPYHKFLQNLINNPVLEKWLPRKIVKNVGARYKYLAKRLVIALLLYNAGGIIEVFADNPKKVAKALARHFFLILKRDPILKEFFEDFWIKSQRRHKRKYKKLTEEELEQYILHSNLLKEGNYLFYNVRVGEGKIKLTLNKLFLEIAKTMLPEITLTTTYITPIEPAEEKEKVSKEKRESETKKEEKEEEEEEKEEVGEEIKIELPEEEKKKPRIRVTRPTDFWAALLNSIKVIMPTEKEEMMSVPVLKFIYNRIEGEIPRGDIFFLVLDLDKLVEWARRTKVYKLYPYYEGLPDEEAAKEFVLTRLVEIFQADEEAYFRIMSIAMNKILEKIYNKMIELGVFKTNTVDFSEFVTISLLMGRASEPRNIVLTVLRNPNFIFILPKELISKAKYADVMLRNSGVYGIEETNITFDSHSVFRCNDCGRYFVGVVKERVIYDEETGKKRKEPEKPICPFCQSHEVEDVYSSNYKFRPSFVSYTRMDTHSGSEKFYVFSSVSEILGPVIDAESTPLLLIPFHQYERKGTSPVKKVVPVLVGILDVELVEDEEKSEELLQEALEKLERVKDPIEKLKIIAKSVNIARSTRILKYVDYAIIAHLIALATSTNKKIVIEYDNGHEEILRDIKPSINILSIGESSAAKSTIVDKLSVVFPDKMIVYSLYKFTARQLSGYATQYKPRKSILASMQNKMLVLDEATYAREEGVYAVFRNILEYGRLEDGTTINTAFEFIMNDPLNVNLDAAKGLRSIRNAAKVAAEIQKKFGDYHTILDGLYSYMMLGLVSLSFTKAFLERMRMFVIARDYSKVYADTVEVTKKYTSELKALENKDLLLSPREIRALFSRKIFPISTIIVPESVANLATKYARYFSILFRKAGEKLDESITNADILFTNLMDISVERIKNSLILVASGIAKILRFDEAMKEEDEIVLYLTERDIELAKYFYITFSPDYLHDLAMKQLDEIIKHLDSNEDKIREGEISVIDYDSLLAVASQVKINTIDVKLHEEIRKVKITEEILADIAIQVIKQSYEAQEPWDIFVEPVVKSVIGEDNPQVYENIKNKLTLIIESLRRQDKIMMNEKGVIYDIYDRSILSKKRMKVIVSAVEITTSS